jgi:hypothetical protein
MKRSDKIIRDILKKNIHRIEDDSFTERIIKIHLAAHKKPSFKPFFNFDLLVIGMLSVVISIGLVYSVIAKIELVQNLVIKEQYCLIILTLSLLFLIYFWLEDFISPNRRSADKNR